VHFDLCRECIESALRRVDHSLADATLEHPFQRDRRLSAIESSIGAVPEHVLHCDVQVGIRAQPRLLQLAFNSCRPKPRATSSIAFDVRSERLRKRQLGTRFRLLGEPAVRCAEHRNAQARAQDELR
jgi:hypothetical protein